MRKDKLQYKYMACNDEITVHNDGVIKETKSTILKTVLEERICVFSNMYCVFSNMYCMFSNMYSVFSNMYCVFSNIYCVFSNMYYVFSNMYSEVQHISQTNNFVDQIMKDHPRRR
jgi:hypothetical protein